MAYASFDFYPGDWEKEGALMEASCEAQSIWLRMICMMHRATPRGHFLNEAGQVPNVADLAARFGKPADLVERALREIVDRKIADVIDGVIVCRKMLKQAERKKEKITGHIARATLDAAGKIAHDRARAADRQKRARDRKKAIASICGKPDDASRNVTQNVTPSVTERRDEYRDASRVTPVTNIVNFSLKSERVTDGDIRDPRTPSSLLPEDNLLTERSTMGAACHPEGRQPPKGAESKPAQRRAAALAALEPKQRPGESAETFEQRHAAWAAAQKAGAA